MFQNTELFIGSQDQIHTLNFRNFLRFQLSITSRNNHNGIRVLTV